MRCDAGRCVDALRCGAAGLRRARARRQVALHLAQWANPAFASTVNDWVVRQRLARMLRARCCESPSLAPPLRGCARARAWRAPSPRLTRRHRAARRARAT
jgi:hypothetical protein